MFLTRLNLTGTINRRLWKLEILKSLTKRILLSVKFQVSHVEKFSMALRYIGQVNFIQGNQFSCLTCPDGKWSKKLSYNTSNHVLNLLDDKLQSLAKGHRFTIKVIKVQRVWQIWSGLKKTIEFSFHHFIFIFCNLREFWVVTKL